MLHPRGVFTLWFNNRAISPALLTNVLGFFLLFMVVYVAGVVILTLGGRDLVTSVGATAATLGNIGPGIGLVGPASNYSFLAGLGKMAPGPVHADRSVGNIHRPGPVPAGRLAPQLKFPRV